MCYLAYRAFESLSISIDNGEHHKLAYQFLSWVSLWGQLLLASYIQRPTVNNVLKVIILTFY